MDPSSGSNEERDTERAFEDADLLRHGGLANIQGVSGARERSGTDRGEDASDLLERYKLSF